MIWLQWTGIRNCTILEEARRWGFGWVDKAVDCDRCRNPVRARTSAGFLMTASIYSLWRFIFIISFFLLSAGNRSFCFIFSFCCEARNWRDNAMQDIKNTNKTPVFHTRQEFWKWHQPGSVVCTWTAIPDGEIMCIFFGKAKIRRENKMKKTSKQDTGFVPRQIQIWKCAKPSESVRSAVKSQQQVLNTVCKMYCVWKMQWVRCPNSDSDSDSDLFI